MEGHFDSDGSRNGANGRRLCAVLQRRQGLDPRRGAPRVPFVSIDGDLIDRNRWITGKAAACRPSRTRALADPVGPSAPSLRSSSSSATTLA